MYSIEQWRVWKKKFLLSVKEKVIQYPNRPTQQIYETEVHKALSSDDAPESLHDYGDIKHVLKYSRSKDHESLPSILKELEVLDRQKVIVRGGKQEQFLIFDSKNKNRILVFCSETSCRILSLAKNWHGDGTFHCSAKFFHQLYVIHAIYIMIYVQYDFYYQ